MVQGTVWYDGRRAVLARMLDTVQLYYMFRTVTLLVDAFTIVDRAAGLPLMTRVQLRGNAEVPIFSGPIDYVVTTAIALPGMGNPVEAAFAFAVQHLTHVAATLGGAGFLPAMVRVAPPPAPAPKPAAPAPRPAPQAAPAPARPAEAAPAKPSGRPEGPENVIRRLESLKSLFDRGLITKEQFETRQKEILGEL